MCGIVGAAGSLGYKEENIFSHLLKLSTFRGEDSTGVIEATYKHDLSIMKCLGGPWNLNHGDGYSSPAIRLSALIGHTRYATIGKITKENTHPFEFDNLVGVHNGTIKWGLKYEKEYESDSQALYHELNECENFKEMGDVLNRIVGAYALVWWDKKNNLLNFVRNDQRPLWFLFPGKVEKGGSVYYTSADNAFYWASEKRMLEFLGSDVFEDDTDYKYWGNWAAKKPQEIDKPMYIKLPTDTIWSFKVHATGYKLVEEYKLPKKFHKITTIPVGHNSGGVVDNKTDNKEHTNFFLKLSKGYKGILISKQKILDLLEEYTKKCCFCGEPLDKKYYWAAPDVPVCGHCHNQLETVN